MAKRTAPEVAARSWWVAVGRALRPRPARPAYGSAAVVLLAEAVFGVSAALFHVWAEVGVAYLAVACAAVLMAGSLQTRVVTAMTQCAGAFAGMGLGVVASSSGTAGIIVPTVAAVVAGAVGAVGPALTAASLMTVIGLAYAQFGGSPLPWWQLCLWYAIGTATVTVPLVIALAVRGRREDRALIADVLDRAADLLEAVGTEEAVVRRAALAASSARCRDALQDHLLRRTPLLDEYAAAVDAALGAASAHAADGPVAAISVAQLRGRADLVRRSTALARGTPLPRPAPGRRRARSAWAAVAAPAARRAGLRLGLCMGVASAVTLALRDQSHSFWLPLTVAVVVRPEYGSVFGRTVNRVAGTVGGAVVAAGALMLVSTGLPVAFVAAAALAGGVLFSRYSYSFSVAGATACALLSSSISSRDPLIPAIRLLDTVLGCVLAIVLGYLLWPEQRRGTESTDTATAVTAAKIYLDHAAGQGAVPAAVRDSAYRAAHQLVARTLATIDEPPPAGRLAADLLPDVLELDHLIDDISALATSRDQDDADRIRAKLHQLGDANHF